MKLSSHFKKYTVILLCGYLPYGLVTGETLESSWPTNSALFHIGNLNGADDLWKDAFEEGANRWNDVPTSFQFRTSRTSGTGFCGNTGNNSVQFSTTFCGDTWGSRTLAVTRTWLTGSTTNKADIIFNDHKDWDVYDGEAQPHANDFRRTAIHEMGHSAGLGHPTATDIIMSAISNDAFLPALDDINSLRGIYGSTTHILTIENAGDGVISVTPLVSGTGVVSDNVLRTSNYGSFLDCNDSLCQIPIQDGLRLSIEAHPNASNGVEFVSWSGTTIQSNAIQLAPFVDDRTLTAHYTVGFDADLDDIPDNVDNCPFVENTNQKNTDGDDAGDACDAFIKDPTETLDNDSDGVGDNVDNCPMTPNENQLNTDGDTQGNLCDSDDDNDGIRDNSDDFPLDSSESIDTDGDGSGNNTDTDDDNDGVQDDEDEFPLDANESLDTDGDGIGNNTDLDDDNDGVRDDADNFPLDASESVDTDGDGTGNNKDTDDDNDGIQDDVDDFPLVSNEPTNTGENGTDNNTDIDTDGTPDDAGSAPSDSTKNIDASENNNSGSGGSISLLELLLLGLIGIIRRKI